MQSYTAVYTCARVRELNLMIHNTGDVSNMMHTTFSVISASVSHYSSEAAVSDYPASSAIDLATEFSPTTYADVYPTFLQIFTSESQRA